MSKVKDDIRERFTGLLAEADRLKVEVQEESPLSAEEEQVYREKLNTLFFKISEAMRQSTLDVVRSRLPFGKK